MKKKNYAKPTSDHIHKNWPNPSRYLLMSTDIVNKKRKQSSFRHQFANSKKKKFSLMAIVESYRVMDDLIQLHLQGKSFLYFLHPWYMVKHKIFVKAIFFWFLLSFACRFKSGLMCTPDEIKADLRQSKKDHGELLRFGIHLTKTPKVCHLICSLV